MRAFERGGGAGKTQDVRQIASFRQAEREGAVEGVAGAERIDRLHLERRHVAQRAAVEPIDAVRPVGDGEETGDMFGQVLQAGAVVVKPGGAVQRLGRRHHMGAERQQRVVHLGRLDRDR